MELYQWVIAIAGGFLAGIINTLAGNGSAVTLSILTEVLGLPGNVANGTNRVGIMFQTTIGAWTFHRHGKLDLSKSWVYILITSIGAIAGILLAVWVSNDQFRNVFRFMLLFMFFVILVKPSRWLIPSGHSRQLPLWVSIPMFLALGVYGGFIQMGMGIFFLAAMVLGARFNLIDANAVKLAVVALYTIAALILFQMNGYINWKIGLIMAIGQSAGAWLTAHYAAKYPGADVWAYRLLVLVVILALIRLFDLDRTILQLF